MFKILIKVGYAEMTAIITEDQLKEIFRLLETSKNYKLESLCRIDNGTSGEEIIELLNQEVQDKFYQD